MTSVMQTRFPAHRMNICYTKGHVHAIPTVYNTTSLKPVNTKHGSEYLWISILATHSLNMPTLCDEYHRSCKQIFLVNVKHWSSVMFMLYPPSMNTTFSIINIRGMLSSCGEDTAVTSQSDTPQNVKWTSEPSPTKNDTCSTTLYKYERSQSPIHSTTACVYAKTPPQECDKGEQV